jgi:hypothetical protein
MTRSEQVKDWVNTGMTWLEGEIERQVPPKVKERWSWCTSRLLARVLVASVVLVMMGCFVLVVRSATRQMGKTDSVASKRTEPRITATENEVKPVKQAPKRPAVVEQPLPPVPDLGLDTNVSGNGKGGAGYVPPRKQ